MLKALGFNSLKVQRFQAVGFKINSHPYSTGTVDVGELAAGAKMYAESKNENSRNRKIIAFLLIFLFFLVGLISLMTFMVVEVTKETKASDDGVMKVAGTDTDVKTASSQTDIGTDGSLVDVKTGKPMVGGGLRTRLL